MSKQGVVCVVKGKRRWSNEEKLRIVSEAFSTDAKITHVARHYDVFPQQIHQWRRKFWPEVPEPNERGDRPTFLPVSVIECTPLPSGPKPVAQSCVSEPIELCLKNGRVLKISADMDRGMLATLIACVEAA